MTRLKAKQWPGKYVGILILKNGKDKSFYIIPSKNPNFHIQFGLT